MKIIKDSPVKATGTELDTGTDDSKFATAKAIVESSISTATKIQTFTNKTLSDAKFISSINAQTGTTYTLVLTDRSKLVTLDNAAAIAVTIPTNASVAFPIGTQIDLCQIGAGKVTFNGAGVTINSKDNLLSIGAQWVAVSLFKTAEDTWLLIGNLTT